MGGSLKSKGAILTQQEKETILKRGTVISVKHPSIFEPVLNVVQKLEGDNIYFRLPEIFLTNNVLKGDHITYQVFYGENEYVFEGIISGIDIHYPRLVQASIDKAYLFNNERGSRRYLVSFQANVQVPGMDKKIYAIVKNLSLSGINIVFKETLDIDTIVNITVSAFINDSEVLEFKANILRTSPETFYNEYGMEISQIDEKNKDLLDKLIYHLEEDEAAFVAGCLK